MTSALGCLCVSITLAGGIAGTCVSTAAPPAAPEDIVIDGRTLVEWRALIQYLDLDAPSAAAAVPGLMQIVESESIPWFTRRQAALTLGRIGRPAAVAVPLLLSLLDADEAEGELTRLWAAKSLALLGPVAAASSERLSEIALDPDESLPLRLTALEALSRIGADSPDVLPAFLVAVSPQIAASDEPSRLQLNIGAAEGLSLLRASAAPAIPHLLEALRSESSLLRLPATVTLGEIGPAAEIAIPTLADALVFDDAPEVADAAAKSLGKIGPAALPVLERLLDDADEEVRLRAVWGLTEQQQRGRELLWQALDDESEMIRVWSAAGLAADAKADAAAVDVLLDSLEAEDRQARIKAYRVLLARPQLLTYHEQRLHRLQSSARPDTVRAATGLLDALEELQQRQ